VAAVWQNELPHPCHGLYITMDVAGQASRNDGHPWAHSDWDELIRDAAEKAGLPKGVCLYTLRHSFITQSLMDGMATLEVARITGTSLAMIEKHYGHLVMDAARTRLELVQLI
jgi:site-specific recombinase XerD